ncbi:MAG: Hsp70 family protein [Acidimicrobiales bacterium]|nr:Hsp70 family protein [Acidimicrobiales bacterium]
MAVKLGVDLGTTWTAAAVHRGSHDGVEPITLGTHTMAAPSVLAVDGEGGIIAGERAERQLATDPSSGVRECKRRLGDETPMVLAGTPYGAEALLGHLLRHVIGIASEKGDPPDEVVLTHPATWGEFKLDLLREAGRVAGLGEVSLLSEPQAAALHYARLDRIGPGDTVAVYDFGGGTLDVALVTCSDDGSDLVGEAQGLERLGGVDVDQIVVAHVNGALDGQVQALDRDDPDVRRALARLRADCTAAKEALSTETETVVAVDVPGLATEVRITRDEFEAALRPRLAETLTALDRTMSSAGVSADELAGVLLVGGSSRIPVVGEEVGRHTGRPVLVDADPKLVVALGAAGGAPRTDAATVAGTGEEAANAGAAAAAAGAAAAAASRDRRRAEHDPDASADRDAAARKAKRAAAGAAGVAGVAGVAAAGVAASRAFGDDGDADDTVDLDADLAASSTEATDESLDAFDDVVAPTGPAGSGGPVSGGRGTAAAGSGGGATVRQAQAPPNRPAPEPAAPTAGGAPASAPRRPHPIRCPGRMRTPRSRPPANSSSSGSRRSSPRREPIPRRWPSSAPTWPHSSPTSGRCPGNPARTRSRRYAAPSTTRSRTSCRT